MTTVGAYRRALFVDTSALGALAHASDENHRRSLALQKRLATESRTLVTTNFVLAELHALLRGKAGRRVALRVILDMECGSIAVVRVSNEDEARAMEILVRYVDKDFSYTDAASFAVMERFGMRDAFTFDRQFARYGFTLLGLEA